MPPLVDSVDGNSISNAHIDAKDDVEKNGAEVADSKQRNEVLYGIRYQKPDGEHIHSRPLPKPAAEIEQPFLVESPVMKVVEVRSTWLEAKAPEFSEGALSSSKSTTQDPSGSPQRSEAGKPVNLPPYESQLRSYIEIMSPAVLEALRCVVDYAPGHDLAAKNLKLYWPYSILVHYDDAIAKYQERYRSHNCTGVACPGKHAYRHIAIVRNFIHESLGTAIEDERKRHARGVATFNMLWLLFPPGIDLLYDRNEVGEYEPYVMGTLDCVVINGAVHSYEIGMWNLCSDIFRIGPSIVHEPITSLAGEVKITSLVAYPFEYRTGGKIWGEKENARRYFEKRGSTFFQLRRQGCWDFRGYTSSFPRRLVEGSVVSDPDRIPYEEFELRVLNLHAEPGQGFIFDRHYCRDCREVIESQRIPARFSGYHSIMPMNVSGMTDHQYFLCNNSVVAYVLKARQWTLLQVSGFQPVHYDKSMLDTLVLEDPHVKQLIQSLTHKYLLELRAEVTREANLKSGKMALDSVDSSAPWSTDFVKGKGEGLIFLLHGKPGVGKTYTAECIAANTGRPLLTITSADIGTDPEDVETKLTRFFKYAKAWNAIILIDEADVFMEHRRVQDIQRNSLVAAFLRAMEYYQGILFLTTNRVGMFDEAFISRINLTIYYPPFSPKARAEVWESFFKKLEREREGEMRVHDNTRAYVEESEELRQLQWNGREIRNAFQIAVSLAETEGDKDSRGTIIIKKEHIRTTVNMSRSFKKYMKDLYRKDEDAVAVMRGNRNDSGYMVGASNEQSYR